MKPISALIVSFLLITLVAGLCFFLWSVFAFPAKDFLESYYLGWIIDETVVYLFRYFMPLLMTAIFITFSLIAPARFDGVDEYSKLVTRHLVLFLFLATGFFVASELLLTGARVRQVDRKSNTIIARHLEERAKQARLDNQFELGFSLAEQYLAIDPSNRAMQEFLIEMSSRSNVQRDEGEQSKAAPRYSVGGGTAEDYYAKAQQYFENEDYFSALYYGERALTLEPARDDIRRRVALTWERINADTPPKEDVQAYDRYARKIQAFRLLPSEIQSDADIANAITAYYILKELQTEVPDDPDVTEYLTAAQEILKGGVFFSDEADPYANLPGTQDILFIQSSQDRKEFVWIGKLVEGQTGIYAFNVEYAVFTADGMSLHVQVPVAKYLSHHLLLRSINPAQDGGGTEPRVLVGTWPEGTPKMIEIEPGHLELGLLSIDPDLMGRLNLFWLWKLLGLEQDFGLSPLPVQREIIQRVNGPFIVLAFSFLSMALAWRLRPRGAGPGVMAFLLLPLLPVGAHFLVQSYEFLTDVILGILLLHAGFWITVGVLIAEKGLLLTVSLLYLAGGRSR